MSRHCVEDFVEKDETSTNVLGLFSKFVIRCALHSTGVVDDRPRAQTEGVRVVQEPLRQTGHVVITVAIGMIALRASTSEMNHRLHIRVLVLFLLPIPLRPRLFKHDVYCI